MADWYNSGTVFVCTSKTEGTPNTALEAAACGCTVVTTPVGNMPELINDGRNGLVVPRERAAIVAGVTNALEKYAALARQMQIDIQPWSWERRGAAFFDLFRDVLETADRPARRRRPQPLSDLSDKLTIFVTTVGAPSYQECRRHLDRQDCIFKLCIIDRVAPMNVAFQRMLDDCTTPYYVQVDEDMLLRPYAARWLHDRMAEADPDVAIVLAYLFDTHLEMPIQGVKIFRHDIVRDFPFAAVSSCEKEHNSRLRENGYRLRIFEPDEVADSVDGTLGLHGTHWTPDTIFERYANLERKYRRVPQDLPWVAETPALFLRRFVDEGSELDLFALMGIIAGKLASIDGDGEEKDYRDYPNLPGLEYARKFFDEFARDRTDGPAALGEFRA